MPVKRAYPPKRRQPKNTSWLVPCEPVEPTEEEKARIRAEDEEIKRRRESFPLH
jgi:hypothetical protein